MLGSTEQSRAWPQASHFLVISVLHQTRATAKEVLPPHHFNLKKKKKPTKAGLIVAFFFLLPLQLFKHLLTPFPSTPNWEGGGGGVGTSPGRGTPAPLMSPRAWLERQADMGTPGSDAIHFPKRFIGKLELPSGRCQCPHQHFRAGVCVTCYPCWSMSWKQGASRLDWRGPCLLEEPVVPATAPCGNEMK